MKSVRNLVFYAMCAAIVVISKELLAFLPNIELVSFLLILFALNFEWKGSIFIAFIFCFLQSVLYGVGLWTPMYFIVWPLLVIVVASLKKYLTNYARTALFSALFGLMFGFLFSIPYFMVSIRTGWIYFIKGIPFDLIHCFGNYIIMALLFDKASHLFAYFHTKYQI
ncbi:MAG: hypothetical protein RR986_08465 [Longicatena sp.]